MNIREALRWTGLVGVAVLGWLAITAAPAGAFVGYTDSPSTIFGTPGSGNGQFSSPVGVAIDNASDDVYVVDQGNNRVERFDAEGKYISQLTGSETPAGSFAAPGEVAVDNSSSPAKGDVYVTDVGHKVIDVFGPDGKYLSQIDGTPSSFAEELYGVAVDASGNVWAYEGYEGVVDEFNDAGSFLAQFRTGRGAAKGFAVDSSGSVYLLFGCGCVGKYTSTGTQLAEWGSLGTALAIDESTNNVYLDTGNGIEEFGAFGEPYGSPVDAFGSGAISSSNGIAVNATTHIVYASQREAGTVAIFRSGLLPDVTTGPANEVEQTSVKLEGVVNPDGEQVTSCLIEYGTNTTYGQTAACAPAPGAGSSPVTVSAKVSGLIPATTYHYRVAAANANGVHNGTDMTFTTPEAVEGVLTGPASEIQAMNARLNGALEPNGIDAHYWFEYGQDESYGSDTPHEDGGEASESKTVSAEVAGLEPNTSYHFRLAAENVFGVTRGEDKTFTTKALPPVLGQSFTVSAITRVTAVVTANIDPEKSATIFHIVYGETSRYGLHTIDFEAGAGLGGQEFHVGLQGLAPDEVYHYAVVAVNQAGTVTGPDQTFTTAAATPPVATTGGASNVTLTTATISGTIDAQGLETSYEFDLGTDTTYGTSIYGEAGSSTEPVALAIALQNLAPGTTYHYRIVAIDSDGKTYGADETFATPAYSNPIVLPFALPLLQTPAIAFPGEPSAPVAKKTTTKKTTKKGKRHTKTKKKAKGKAKRKKKK